MIYSETQGLQAVSLEMPHKASCALQWTSVDLRPLTPTPASPSSISLLHSRIASNPCNYRASSRTLSTTL